MKFAPGRLLRRTRAWLPALCLVCRRTVHREYSLCRQCEADLPWLGEACPRCGEQVDGAVAGPCPRCKLEPPDFDTCFAPFAYRSPVDKLILSYKFSGDFAGGYALSRILSRIMIRRWSNGRRPDLLLPVPLHAARLRRRGFNQALEIARTIAAVGEIPLEARALRKSRPTPPQTEMSGAEQRSANLRGAFELADAAALRGVRHVALVDDVVTTMSTANELSHLLRKAGIAEVEVCCLARAVL